MGGQLTELDLVGIGALEVVDVLAAERQDGRAAAVFDREGVRARHLVAVGRAEEKHAGRCPQAVERLDRLVRRPVLAYIATATACNTRKGRKGRRERAGCIGAREANGPRPIESCVMM